MYEAYLEIEQRELRRTGAVRTVLLIVACGFAGVAIGGGGSVLTAKVAHLLYQWLSLL